MTSSALYAGTVMHDRSFPRRHRFTYGVWYLLADLDELPALDRRIRGFGFNRAAPVSFHEADHGLRDGSPLRPWIERRLAEAGLDLEGGPVRVLTFPRVFGYVFNPLSVWFCHGPGEDLRAILYEVSNTFGQSHDYLVPVRPGEVTANAQARALRTVFDKRLYVSPFIPMAATYDFTTRVPDERISVVVRETAAGGRVLVATLGASRRPLSGRSLAGLLVRYPLVTLKVMAGIHRQALTLWRKGAPFRHRGLPPASPVTIVEGSNRPARGRASEAPAEPQIRVTVPT